MDQYLAQTFGKVEQCLHYIVNYPVYLLLWFQIDFEVAN